MCHLGELYTIATRFPFLFLFFLLRFISEKEQCAFIGFDMDLKTFFPIYLKELCKQLGQPGNKRTCFTNQEFFLVTEI